MLYPILDLRHHKKDVHWYMSSLEEVRVLTLYMVDPFVTPTGPICDTAILFLTGPMCYTAILFR